MCGGVLIRLTILSAMRPSTMAGKESVNLAFCRWHFTGRASGMSEQRAACQSTAREVQQEQHVAQIWSNWRTLEKLASFRPTTARTHSWNSCRAWIAILHQCVCMVAAHGQSAGWLLRPAAAWSNFNTLTHRMPASASNLPAPFRTAQPPLLQHTSLKAPTDLKIQLAGAIHVILAQQVLDSVMVGRLDEGTGDWGQETQRAGRWAWSQGAGPQLLLLR